MDQEQIVCELSSRFLAPLPELYERRIIIWEDADKEFEDQIEDLQLDNAKILILQKNNRFEIKRILHDDTTSNYLIYQSFIPDDKKDNWILDVALYSEEFHADIISIWIDEIGLPTSAVIHDTVKEYQKYFSAKDRRQKIKNMNSAINSRSTIILGVMSSICGIKDILPSKIIRKVLGAGLETDNNSVYQVFIKYNLEDSFWTLVSQITGYKGEHALDKLTYHIFVTALTNTVPLDLLNGLEEYVNEQYQTNCHNLVSDWTHGDDKGIALEILYKVEDRLQMHDRLMKVDKQYLLDSDVFPCTDVVILLEMMHDIKNDLVDPKAINAIIDKRVSGVWYERYEHYYLALSKLSDMQQFYLDHAAGFHDVDPKHIWDNYTSDYYHMDQYYRDFQVQYDEIKTNFHARLSDPFNAVVDKAENLYSNWYLSELGKNWSDICADDLKEYGCISNIPLQDEFYKKNIKYASNKIYVIISDAMRYEVGESLCERLKRDTQAEVEISSVQGIFPTITKFGMAALLPNKQLSVDYKENRQEKLKVLADGSFTDSNYREKILQNEKPNSVVLKYKDLINMARADRQTKVKGMDVVYIYHDTIDEAGHAENNVFGACEDTIKELSNLVKIITNEFGGINILITADHGFLYTNKPLQEDSKVDKTVESVYDIEYGRRYSIVKKGEVQEFLLPVKFLGGKTDFDGFAPRESIRIKMKGSGLNFVHGGISLQEMVVPVISYHFLRNESKEYRRNRDQYDTKPVELEHISTGMNKVTNMIFSLVFYQRDPVSSNRTPAKYEVYFTDDHGQKVSDIQTIVANSTSDIGNDRRYKANFTLKSREYRNTDIYYLVITDEEGLNMKKEEYQFDLAFSMDDIGL